MITDTLNRKKAPHIKDAIEFNLQLKPYEKFVLDNGVEVYAINAGAEDVLQIEWVFFAGNWFEEKNLIAASTNFLLKNGTSQKNAFQISEHFEYYGTLYSIWIIYYTVFFFRSRVRRNIGNTNRLSFEAAEVFV